MEPLRAHSLASEFRSQIRSSRGKLLSFFALQFLYRVCGDNSSTCLFWWMSGLNELIYVKCLEHCLARSKCQ